MKQDRRVVSLAWMGLYAALFIVLDYFSNQIPFFRMPNGGTLGLSTVVLLLASYQMGWKKGLGVALLTIPLQGFFAPYYSVNFFSFFLEYIVAFGVYGLATLFPNFEGRFPIYTGAIMVNLIRFMIHFVSGVVFWEVTWQASFAYNAWYMFPTLLVGVVLTPLILKRLPHVHV
jgi:thiamine transporter